MSRRLFLLGTLLFWALVAGIGLVAGLTAPESARSAASPVSKSPEPPGVPEAVPAPVSPAPPAPEAKRFTLAEVARHATAGDCWMAIRGAVYDLGAYLPEHPTRPQIVVPWCGREATEAYATKLRGRPHSARADALLAKYRIGELGETR